jgi:hypothetical protein
MGWGLPMKWIPGVAVLAFAIASPAAAQAPPAIPPNPQIDILYVPPKNAKYQPFHDRLKQLQVLETLQRFLSPLKLDRKLEVRVDECGGALQLPYRPDQPVVICYEYIASIS